MAFSPMGSQYQQFGVCSGVDQCSGHGVAGKQFLRHGQVRCEILHPEQGIAQHVTAVRL